MYRYPRATVVVPFPKCLSIVKKLVHSCLGDTRSSSRSPCFFSFCSVHQNSNMVDVLIEHMALLTREQEPLHVRRKSEILRKITWCWEWRRRQSPLYSSLANRIIVQSCHHTRLIDDSLCRPHSTTRLWKPKYGPSSSVVRRKPLKDTGKTFLAAHQKCMTSNLSMDYLCHEMYGVRYQEISLAI